MLTMWMENNPATLLNNVFLFVWYFSSTFFLKSLSSFPAEYPSYLPSNWPQLFPQNALAHSPSALYGSCQYCCILPNLGRLESSYGCFSLLSHHQFKLVTLCHRRPRMIWICQRMRRFNLSSYCCLPVELEKGSSFSHLLKGNYSRRRMNFYDVFWQSFISSLDTWMICTLWRSVFFIVSGYLLCSCSLEEALFYLHLRIF